MASISELDSGIDLRVNVFTQYITLSGFYCNITTSGNSVNFKAKVSWISFG